MNAVANFEVAEEKYSYCIPIHDPIRSQCFYFKLYCQEAVSSAPCDLISVEAAGSEPFTDLK